jgi:hypothetical protein
VCVRACYSLGYHYARYHVLLHVTCHGKLLHLVALFLVIPITISVIVIVAICRLIYNAAPFLLLALMFSASCRIVVNISVASFALRRGRNLAVETGSRLQSPKSSRSKRNFVLPSAAQTDRNGERSKPGLTQVVCGFRVMCPSDYATKLTPAGSACPG